MSEELTFNQKVTKLQNELKAPKNQYNSFGKYNYRSCEDILEAVKPLLLKYELTLSFTDIVEEIGGKLFVKTSAFLQDKESGDTLMAVAYAGHEFEKKGMDFSQITGAASSYARKYALNGMFLIDDSKDADATNVGNQEQPKKAKGNDTAKATSGMNKADMELNKARKLLKVAIDRWAEVTGGDADKASHNISKRPDYQSTVEFYTKAKNEFEQMTKDHQSKGE